MAIEKAWGQFLTPAADGDPCTILVGKNVSSIMRSDTGGQQSYLVTLTDDIVNTNVVFLHESGPNSIIPPSGFVAGSVRVFRMTFQNPGPAAGTGVHFSLVTDADGSPGA